MEGGCGSTSRMGSSADQACAPQGHDKAEGRRIESLQQSGPELKDITLNLMLTASASHPQIVLGNSQKSLHPNLHKQGPCISSEKRQGKGKP